MIPSPGHDAGSENLPRGQLLTTHWSLVLHRLRINSSKWFGFPRLAWGWFLPLVCFELAIGFACPRAHAAGPYAATFPPGPVTRTNATLIGMATANGAASTAWFEWGLASNSC